jgi:hypothetical protein
LQAGEPPCTGCGGVPGNRSAQPRLVAGHRAPGTGHRAPGTGHREDRRSLPQPAVAVGGGDVGGVVPQRVAHRRDRVVGWHIQSGSTGHGRSAVCSRGTVAPLAPASGGPSGDDGRSGAPGR